MSQKDHLRKQRRKAREWLEWLESIPTHNPHLIIVFGQDYYERQLTQAREAVR